MKPKLTTENKAKIFALYWDRLSIKIKGQENTPHSTYTSYGAFDCMNEEEFQKAYIELRPLSSITDEEVQSLGFKNIEDWIRKIYEGRGEPIPKDQLRLMGFAVSWCGWSVEELVKEGIFKIKQ